MHAPTANAEKEEGSFVDTAIGKDKAEKLKQTLKESENVLTSKFAESAGKLVPVVAG